VNAEHDWARVVEVLLTLVSDVLLKKGYDKFFAMLQRKLPGFFTIFFQNYYLTYLNVDAAAKVEGFASHFVEADIRSPTSCHCDLTVLLKPVDVRAHNSG
jgi:hypothetical protein